MVILGSQATGPYPGVANLPASCGGTFPCPESAIWAGGKSFPNLRNGTYRAWSILRVVSNGTSLTNVKALVSKSNFDPGFTKQRSHYGPGAVNTGLGEKGRDAGGCTQSKGSSITQKVQEAPGVACSTFVPH